LNKVEFTFASFSLWRFDSAHSTNTKIYNIMATQPLSVNERLARIAMSTNERLSRIERLVLLSAKEALTVPETALLLGISESRVRHLVCDKALPYYKQGAKVYFRKSELEDWMLQDRQDTKAETDRKAATYCATRRRKF
jgi:excisionase family DNA binding protein